MNNSFSSHYNIPMTLINYSFNIISKKLRLGWISNSGRNFSGRICVHHRGGGDKKSFYLVDFYRRVNCYGYVIKKYKISFYTSLLAFVIYQNGLSSNILWSDSLKLKKSDKIYSGTFGKKVPLNVGTALPLNFIKLFTAISHIELYPFSGIVLARSAGASVMLTAQEKNTTVLKLKSGWYIRVSNYCICSIGNASNKSHNKKTVYKKAGLFRSLGIRPTVRGVAMNPCDHPHGGGEGKKSPLVSSKSPWGRLTKGTKTVKQSFSSKRWLFRKKRSNYRHKLLYGTTT